MRNYEYNSSTETVNAPVEKVVGDWVVFDDPKSSSSSSVLRPGQVYIINSVSDGRAITLQDGEIELASPTDSTAHWICIKHKGWYGFRNAVSGKLLGHNIVGDLCCFADEHKAWERFHVSPGMNGGYVLHMTDWDSLWHVGTVEREGLERLAKVEEGDKAGLGWEFIEADALSP